MKKSNPVPIKPHFEANGKVNLPAGTYLKAVTNLNKDAYNDSFVFLFKKAYPCLLELHTITAYKTYFTLIQVLMEQGTYRLVITQKQLSIYLGCAGAEISKAIAELERVDLVILHTRGLIIMNPKYIWKGSLAAWQVAVEETKVY